MDWVALHRNSATINDFIRKLLEDLQRFPPSERADALVGVLNSIDDMVGDQHVTAGRVGRHLEAFERRGIDPERALPTVLERHLRTRRALRFRGIFGPFAQSLARSITTGITTTALARPEAFERVISYFRPDPPIVPRNMDAARARLRETDFPAEFQYWALNRKPMTAEDIAFQVRTDLNRGVPRSEALYRGVLLAIREFVLDLFMSAPVSLGPDFCVLTALAVGLSAAGVAISLGTGIAGIVLSVQARNDARDSMRRQETRARETPLTMSEIREIAQLIAEDESITKLEDALESFLDEVRTRRLGREELVENEEKDFTTYWEEFYEQAEALRRAEEEARRQVLEERRRVARAQADLYAARGTSLIEGGASELARRENLSLYAGIVFPLVAIAGVGALYFLTRE